MTEYEEGWIVGILEGEACFDHNRTPKYPRIRVEMADKDVLDRLQSLIGGRLNATKRREGWSQYYVLSIHGQAAVDLMTKVQPCMSKRRGEKITSVLAARLDALA